MGKPVVGEVVVLPFPQTDLHAGKRRPALVVADAGGSDVILCQITSQSRSDPFSVPISRRDFDQGQLAVDSYARVTRLFTIDAAVIVYTAARLNSAKIAEVRSRLRQVFS